MVGKGENKEMVAQPVDARSGIQSAGEAREVKQCKGTGGISWYRQASVTSGGPSRGVTAELQRGTWRQGRGGICPNAA